MIDVETATRIAERVLNEHFQLTGDRVVVTDAWEDDEAYWFQYNSQRFLETDDLMYAIVEGHPIGIRKADGTVV
jgi:hypothetical protein